MKDEALKLALEALVSVVSLYGAAYTPTEKRKLVDNAITALQKALANNALDKKAENAKGLGLDYEPAPVQPVAVVGEDKHGPFVDWLGDKSSFYDRHPVGTEFFAASPAAQPAVPDAIHPHDISESLEYILGWNDCRQAMLEMMK